MAIMGTYPNTMLTDAPEIEMIPVDFVSSSIVAIALQSNCYGKTFNIINPNTHVSISSYPFARLSRVINSASRVVLFEGKEAECIEFRNSLILKLQQLIPVYEDMGYKMKKISMKEWVDSINNDISNPLLPLISYFRPPKYSFETTVSHHSNLLNAINGRNTKCAPPTSKLVTQYLKFYQQVGWIPMPLLNTEKCDT